MLVMLAEAPMGVRLPPRVAPDRSPKYKTVGSTPISRAIFCTTGNMVATYGMLSMNAENSTLAQTMTV